MKNILKLFAGIVVCSSILAGEKLEDNNVTALNIRHNEIKSTSAENKPSMGLSIDNPIVLNEIKDYEKIKETQRSFIEENYPGYRIISDGFRIGTGIRCIQSLRLKNEEGNKIDVFFDVTDAHTEFERKNRKELGKIAKKMGASIKKNDTTENDLIGTRFDKPISLKNVKTSEDIIKREKDFIGKHYPEYRIIRKETWFLNKKFMERVSLEKGDDRIIINFDVSDYIREYRKKNPVKLIDLSPGVQRVEKGKTKTSEPNS